MDDSSESADQPIISQHQEQQHQNHHHHHKNYHHGKEKHVLDDDDIGIKSAPVDMDRLDKLKSETIDNLKKFQMEHSNFYNNKGTGGGEEEGFKFDGEDGNR